MGSMTMGANNKHVGNNLLPCYLQELDAPSSQRDVANTSHLHFFDNFLTEAGGNPEMLL